MEKKFNINKRVQKLEDQVDVLVKQMYAIGDAHNRSVDQMGMNTAYIQWACSNLTDAQFEEFQEFMAECGIQVDRDPEIMIPDKKIIVPGG